MKNKFVENLINNSMKYWKTPGLAFGIVYKGKIIFERGFGFHNLEEKLPVTSSTLFPIGSSSKSFLGIAYAMLSLRKDLDLDKPISSIIREFQLSDAETTKNATWRDLLSHQTGMPRHEMLWIKKDFTGQEIVELFPHLPLNKKLREEFQYCNPMYVAASYFLERITHENFDSYITKNILEPLGMHNTSFSCATLHHLRNMSCSYSTTSGEPIKIDHFTRDNLKGAGGIVSTIADMCRWLNELTHNHQTISEEVLTQATHPNCATPLGIVSFLPNQNYSVGPSYGLGWINELYRGNRLIHHGGSINGFNSLVAFLPHHELGFVCLHNHANSLIHKSLILNCIDELLDLEKVNWDSSLSSFMKSIPQQPNMNDTPEDDPSKPPSHSLASYLGAYLHPGYGTLSITLQDDLLYLNYGEYRAQLLHCLYETFKFRFNIFNFAEKVTFHSDENDKINRLSLKAEPTLPALIFDKRLSKQYTGIIDQAETEESSTMPLLK